jgi:signal transduction histidine kinase
MEKDIHPFLKRQLRRFYSKTNLSEDEVKFIEAVNSSYNHFSRERELMEIASNRMIEEMKKKNENLKRLISSLDEFNYHVSHDLKAGAINNLSLAQMLNKYKASEDSSLIDEITKKLEENSERHLKTIHQFLRIAKLDIDLFSTDDVEEVDVENMLIELGKSLGEENFNMQISFEGNRVISYSHVQLRSIFHNLMTNAIRFSKEDKLAEIEITIITDKGGDKVIFKDYGIGIDLEERGNKIFKAFEADTRYSDSSGVGLYLTKKIIESNGGTIDLWSKLGKGVVFTINL